MIDRSNGRISQTGKWLTITKINRNGFFREIESSEKTPPDFESQNPFSAFLGIINIFDKSFLLMVKDVHRMGKLEEFNVYQISTVSFIPFEVFFSFPNIIYEKIGRKWNQ